MVCQNAAGPDLCRQPGLRRTPRRAADAMVDVLVEAGVEVVFGIPGGAISPLHDALLDRPEIRVVTTRHESGAAFAAAGYARTSGKLGVVLVTSGPGAFNALTGVASAYCDGLPVLIIAGEVPRQLAGKGVLQDGSPHHLNMLGVFRNVTKLAAEVPSASAAPSLLRQAMATALSGRRGPAMLTLPVDVATATTVPPQMMHRIEPRFEVEPWAIDAAIQLLARARRPLLLAGSGVRQGGGPAMLRALAERSGVPVVTTPKGKGVFPESHPLSLGVFGMGGHLSATAYLERGVDVLFAVGTSLGDVATNGWSAELQPSRAFIHVDLEARQVGRAYEPDLAIVAPAEMVLGLLVARLPLPLRENVGGGVRRLEDPEEAAEGPSGLITPQRALWEAQSCLPPDTIFAIDSGEHFVFATHYLQIDQPDAFIAMIGLGSMGSSIGAAIGAKLARPDREVAIIIGDGGFAMVGSELATAVALELPISVFVINDERYGMVENGHEAVYGRRPSYPTAPLDVVQVARGLGARALRVERAGEILTASSSALGGGGPVVFDVRVDPAVRMHKTDRIKAVGDAAGKRSAQAFQNAVEAA